MPANRSRNARGQSRTFSSNQGHSVQPFGSNDNRALLVSQGPLMTNHLQLDELDLELALLKRKREMIEKQANMLVSDSRYGGSSQYGFNQAPQSYSQRSEPTRNFSNFYNDPPEPQYSRFNTQQGVKRPAIDPWDNSSPKRFNAPSGYKKPTTRYEPKPSRSQPASQPPPLMSSSFRQRRPPLPATRTNFKPTKVTKPRQNTVPNKLNAYPIVERKNLVNKASGVVQKPTGTIMYEADKPTDSKLQGRLALALGNIVREIRDEYGAVEPHDATLTNVSSLRALKQAIRERIRTITIGTPVGSATDVVALYRKQHPKDTDIELLNIARENMVQKGNLAIDIIKQGNPERYFKTNFRRLLEAGLTEMFEKMQLLYTNVRDGRSVQVVIDSLLVDLNKSLQEVEVYHEEDSAAIETSSDTHAAEKTKTGESAVEVDGTTTKPEESAAKLEKKDDEPKQNDDKPAENGDTKAARPVETNRDEFVRAKFYSRLMETLMRRSIPNVLPKFKDLMIKILNTNEAFMETKAYIIQTTNEKFDEINKNPMTATSAALKDKKTFFVRIQGRPALPKKRLMKAFLDTFHPTLIKKHRNVHNILFVSFDDEESFKNILAKNGETIANCRLDIKVSERINKNKNEPQNANNDQQDTKLNDTDVEMVEPRSDDAIKLDESLDNQISDLLSSLREEEEKNDDNPENQDNKEAHGNSQSNEETKVLSDAVIENSQKDKVKTDAMGTDKIEREAVEKRVEAAETENQHNKEVMIENQQTDEVKANATGNDKTEPEVDEKSVERTENENEAPDKSEADKTAKNEAEAKGTPIRSSARLTATPSSIRTRRASKLGN